MTHPARQTTPAPATEPRDGRRIGRSRPYTSIDLCARFLRWHAPRVNRWEQVCVTSGHVELEIQASTGIECVPLVQGDARWFAPGTRWRVAHMSDDGEFGLEMWADDKGQAAAPEPLRAELLDQAGHVTVRDAAALAQLVTTLPTGLRRIVETDARVNAASMPWLTAHRVSWHLLERDSETLTALVMRTPSPFDLAAYLGRDHAVIEAALGMALQGDKVGMRWLRATLERHLGFEEQLIFPAYAAAGGEAMVTGLLHEHAFLRRHLAGFDDAHARKLFLRLLDAHDEKEENLAYPDILAKLGQQADALITQVAAFGLPPGA